MPQATAESFRKYVLVMHEVAYQASQRASPTPSGNTPNANGTPNELEEKTNKFGKVTNGFKRALKDTTTPPALPPFKTSLM